MFFISSGGGVMHQRRHRIAEDGLMESGDDVFCMARWGKNRIAITLRQR